MEKFGKSQSVVRTEDVRFLTGEGQYVDDIAPDGALHGFFFRSSYAHGVIAELDVSDAAASEGVHAVLTCADLEAAGMDIAMPGTQVQNRDGSKGAGPLRPLLAKDRVRYVGEPVALIVAETLAQARDAAELILFDHQGAFYLPWSKVHRPTPTTRARTMINVPVLATGYSVTASAAKRILGARPKIDRTSDWPVDIRRLGALAVRPRLVLADEKIPSDTEVTRKAVIENSASRWRIIGPPTRGDF